MASEQNRHRILYLLKYFQEKSDEKNGVSIRDMQSDLQSKGINADRRTLYRDIEELRSIGYDIIAQRGSVTTSSRSVGRANACISLPAGILNWQS